MTSSGVAGVAREVVPQEGRAEVEPHEPAALGEDRDLVVHEVARGRRERVDVGVGGDEGRPRDGRDVAQPGRVEVAHVDQDAQLVAGAHERAARVGEARAVLGGAAAERDAGREGVGVVPRQAQRSQPGGRAATSSAASPGSMAQAPSRCSTTARAGAAASTSAAERHWRTAPFEARSMRRRTAA